ncbi:uncharacterized protein LOC132953189 [Metopolophium dirhodum]|uniref:uncharacterized protein LOC132953189 n=1 Tax=Metopolophium dirhodum TaxID=44670 RepID=UPI00298F6FCE|nr:uncharacterized protein LOC132953189 [Metopolophium dirhodum]
MKISLKRAINISKQPKKLPRSNKPPIFANNISDSENGEDTNDDSDIDKSYNPNVAKADSDNESSDNSESTAHISTILYKNDSETQLLGTMSEVNNLTDADAEAENIIYDIPDTF